MARVTVEDCLEKVDNYFDLVLIATKRARQLAAGTEQPFLPWDNDKPTVMALREIAAGYVDAQIMNDIIVGHEKTREAADALPHFSEADAADVDADAPFQGFTTTGFSTLDDQIKQKANAERGQGEL